VLLRHGKSAWPTGVSDLRRPLAKRGRRDATAVGRWLHEHAPRLDAVVCSPAERARQTWTLVAAELDDPPPASDDERVYGATATQLLALVRNLPIEIDTAVLVGHNPHLQGLAELMTGQDVEMKTSGVAIVEWPDRWTDTGPGTTPPRHPPGLTASSTPAPASRVARTGPAHPAVAVEHRDHDGRGAGGRRQCRGGVEMGENFGEGRLGAQKGLAKGSQRAMAAAAMGPWPTTSPTTSASLWVPETAAPRKTANTRGGGRRRPPRVFTAPCLEVLQERAAASPLSVGLQVAACLEVPAAAALAMSLYQRV